MTTMACNWNGLFSVGEEFDDEDLLETDWTEPSELPCASASSVAPSSVALRAPTAPSSHNAQRDPLAHSTEPYRRDIERGSALPRNAPVFSTLPPTLSSPLPPSPPPCVRVPCGGAKVVPPLRTSAPPNGGAQDGTPFEDEFDDWDVDLDDLDEKIRQSDSAPGLAPAPGSMSAADDSVSLAKRLRASACAGGASTVPALRGAGNSAHASGTVRRPFAAPLPAPAVSQSPVTLSARTPGPGSTLGRGASTPSPRFANPVVPRVPRTPPQWQGGGTTLQTSGRPPGSLFQAISPAPSPSLTPRPLHTPILTNHLVQLVSAANKTPQRPRGNTARPKTRRFPGPAGMLPQQVSERSLDDIVVTVPQTPAHGAVARLPVEVPSSQASEEDEFSSGPWAAMKAEMGLDEKNPACFLHSYSVVMVLRKAALRQLAKNKVPNMAVVLKSILPTHADAKAVFRDPTGEMQGTVHRRLLEDRQGELKSGAVLLLKQVGVFSPSHRNHYLNVTPNNLLRIYPPDGALQTPTLLSQQALDPTALLCSSSRSAGGTVHPLSQMELRFEDEEVEEDAGAAGRTTAIPPAPIGAPQDPTGGGPCKDVSWDTDDLDEFLTELPLESYDGI